MAAQRFHEVTLEPGFLPGRCSTILQGTAIICGAGKEALQVTTGGEARGGQLGSKREGSRPALEMARTLH